MTNNTFHTLAKWLFAISILCIGLVHFVFGTFPIGFEPVSAALPAKHTLALVFGAAMVFAAGLSLVKQYSYAGSAFIAVLLAIITFGMHLPKLLADIANGGIITGFSEGVVLLGGALMLIALADGNKTIFAIGRMMLVISLMVFGVLHIKYAEYIWTLIPKWLPAHNIFNYLVITAFFGSALSFLLNLYTKQVGMLLSAMFLIWFVILHLPRAFASSAIEAEWTSAFIALCMSGLALLPAASPSSK